MQNKIRVGILFGGQSAEHKVSLQTAKNVYDAIDKNKYEVILIGIGKDGRWYANNQDAFLLHDTDPKLITLNTDCDHLALLPYQSGHGLINLTKSEKIASPDVIFPLLHGPYGEDGTIQGLVKLANIPCIGSDVLGSAVSMDKDVCKRLLQDAGMNISKFLVYTNKSKVNFQYIQQNLGLPFFVKPANLGSSIGISKVHNEEEFQQAISIAFSYDEKIIIEEHIDGREIECAVLGNNNPTVSIAGEIIPTHEYYDYEAKYIDINGAELKIPANISPLLLEKIQAEAIKSFKVLCCSGMARVDFFLTKDDKIYINEINTIPGFTKISMYPKLWEKSGISYASLIDQLITLAIEKHKQVKINTNLA